MFVNYPTFQLEVQLCRTDPPVRRSLRISAQADLHTLHRALQAVMGWQNYHLYEFVRSGRRYTEPAEDFFDDSRDSRRTVLCEVLQRPGDKLTYIYDFGDYWLHRVTLTDVILQRCSTPVCVGGQRACPPEDCGGLPNYRQLVGSYNAQDLCGNGHWRRFYPEYDPDEFDCDAAQKRLYHLDDSRPVGSYSMGSLLIWFMEDQEERLSERTYKQYLRALPPLLRGFSQRGHLYTSVDVDIEDSLLRHYVGIKPLLGYLGEFFDFHLPLQEYATKTLVKQCGVVLRSFLRWAHGLEFVEDEVFKYYHQKVGRMAEAGYSAAEARWHIFDPFCIRIGGRPDKFDEEVLVVRDVEADKLRVAVMDRGNAELTMNTDPDFTRLCEEGMVLVGQVSRTDDGWLLFDARNVLPSLRGNEWGWPLMPYV